MSAQSNILNLNNNLFSQCSHYYLCELCGETFARASMYLKLGSYLFNFSGDHRMGQIRDRFPYDLFYFRSQR